MDPILTNLTAYAGKWQKTLIGQIFLMLENQNITVLEGIKGKTFLPKLTVAGGIKPYTGTHAPSDKWNYTDRAVDPQMFQYDGTIDPRKYRLSYMTEMTDKHAKATAIPFENFTWKKTIEAIASEIVTKSLYKGIQGGVNVDAAYNICNGIEKRITDFIAGGKAALATGAITAANAVTKFEDFYSTAMALNEAHRALPQTLYCSHANLDNYIDHYRTLFNGNDPDNWNDVEKPMYLKKNKGKVKIIAADWLGTSERIILAPQGNIVLATDSLGDYSTISIVPRVYGLDYGISGTIDLQVPDADLFHYNDQA